MVAKLSFGWVVCWLIWLVGVSIGLSVGFVGWFAYWLVGLLVRWYGPSTCHCDWAVD